MFAGATERCHAAQSLFVGEGLHLFLSREILLANATDGAHPVVGQVLEGGAGGYTVVGVAQFRIIDITAGVANILFHSRYCCFEG